MIKGRTLIALVLPVVCTGAFWLVLPAAYRASESSDFSSFYEPVAVRLLAGQGITTESGAVAMRYPPGFPIVLAAAIGTGRALGLSEEHALDVLALACVAISSLLLHLIAREIWSGWAALVPSAAWSTYPLVLWLTKQPNSELVFTPLLFACAFVLWKLTRDVRPRAGMVLAMGACAGAAMLVRPIALFLPLVCGALVLVLAKEWSVRARAVTAASVLAVALLVVLPWELRASSAAGHFVMLSDGGVPAMRDGLTFAVNTKKDYRGGIRVPDAVRTVMVSFYAQYDQLELVRRDRPGDAGGVRAASRGHGRPGRAQTRARVVRNGQPAAGGVRRGHPTRVSRAARVRVVRGPARGGRAEAARAHRRLHPDPVLVHERASVATGAVHGAGDRDSVRAAARGAPESAALSGTPSGAHYIRGR